MLTNHIFADRCIIFADHAYFLMTAAYFLLTKHILTSSYSQRCFDQFESSKPIKSQQKSETLFWYLPGLGLGLGLRLGLGLGFRVTARLRLRVISATLFCHTPIICHICHTLWQILFFNFYPLLVEFTN